MQQSLLTHLSRLLNYPSFSLILHPYPPIRHSLSHPSFSPSSFSLSYILPLPSPLLLFPSLFLPFSSPRGDTVHPRCVPDAFYQSRMSCRPWLSKRDVRGVPSALVMACVLRLGCWGSVTRGNVVLFSLFFTFLSCEASRKK